MGTAYAESLSGIGAIPSGSPQSAPVPVTPSSTPTDTPSATALPSATPSASTPSVIAIVPDHIIIPATDRTPEVNTVVLSKPSETRFNKWLNKDMLAFGVPEKTDKDPATGKPLGNNKFAVTTWWSDGPKVGAIGQDGMLAVILGHTMMNGYSVFNKIGAMLPGDMVVVSSKAGPAPIRLITIKVVTGIDKRDESALNQVLQNAPEGAIAVLVTCSGIGEDDAGRPSQPDNTVVFLGLAPLQGSGM